MKSAVHGLVSILALSLLAACGGDAPEQGAELTAPTPPAEQGNVADPAQDAATAKPETVASLEEVSMDGKWGTDLAQCANFQEVMDAPMILTAEGYDQHETHCTFDSVVQTAPNAWSVEGSCSVEGYQEPMEMSYTIEGDQLIRSVGDHEWPALVRCP